MYDREVRVLRAPAPELRAEGDAPVLDGYAAVFMTYSRNLGGFVEQIDPAAFRDTLSQQGRDIVGLFNHDPNRLLASTQSHTLELSADATGLRYAMTLDPSDPDALSVMAKVRTGKLRGSSFAFRAVADDWGTTDQGFPLRTLKSVELFDVSAVTTPAYPATEADGLSVALRSLASAVGAPVDRLVEAARANTLAQFMGGAPAVESPGAPSFPLRSQWAARFGVRPSAGS